MKISKGYELQVVYDEAILTPTDEESNDKAISLDPLSAELWEEMSKIENFTIETMAESLTQQYDVEKDITLEDCKMIAQTWIEMGIAEP
jgi:hypothetical protein